jgi:dTDP-4-dehydrorhamnose reductase
MTTTAVVGASGPLGTCLTELLMLGGRRMRPLSRRATAAQDRVDVLDDDAEAVLAGVDEVVYCAWDTADRSPASQQRHVAAAGRWAAASARVGASFVFTSTVLAAQTETSSYGMHKEQAERLVAEAAGTSVRIGLVTDDAYPFLATRLRSMCRRMPALAAALDVPVFAIGSTDVATAIAAELTSPRAGGVVWLAPEAPCSLKDVVSWGVGRPRPSAKPGRGRLLAVAASLPIHRGVAGRYVDALTGLMSTPERRPDVLQPLAGPVDGSSWQQHLQAGRRSEG